MFGVADVHGFLSWSAGRITEDTERGQRVWRQPQILPRIGWDAMEG